MTFEDDAVLPPALRQRGTGRHQLAQAPRPAQGAHRHVLSVCSDHAPEDGTGRYSPAPVGTRDHLVFKGETGHSGSPVLV
jgi:hypothetical protein